MARKNLKTWMEFNEAFIDNSESLIDVKMTELNELLRSISGENNETFIYEWENKDDHQLNVTFEWKGTSIKYEFDVDQLYISKYAGNNLDFQKDVESIDEGLDIIEKDIHLIVGISEKFRY